MKLEESLSVATALADRSRLLILDTLRAGPMCVEELTDALQLAGSTVSFHLKKLGAAGLVTPRRDQYYTVYELRPRYMRVAVAELIALDEGPAQSREEAADRERAKVIDTFFSRDGLLRMPVQKRKRDVVLEEFAALFVADADYGEAQVNATIMALRGDHCLIRRLLVDEGYLDRKDGVYRRTGRPVRASLRHQDEEPTDTGDRTMTNEGEGDSRTRRAALRRSYKERAKQAGIFRVRNTANGRVLLGSALDLHAPLNRVAFELDQKVDWNRELRRDLDVFGRDSFVVEVLETVETRNDPDFDPEKELEILEQKHLAALDRATAYNRNDRIRYP